MSEEIEILREFPIVFTKDAEWLQGGHARNFKARPGAIMLLPQDAVLCVLPEKVVAEAPRDITESSKPRSAGGSDAKK